MLIYTVTLYDVGIVQVWKRNIVILLRELNGVLSVTQLKNVMLLYVFMMLLYKVASYFIKEIDKAPLVSSRCRGGDLYIYLHFYIIPILFLYSLAGHPYIFTIFNVLFLLLLLLLLLFLPDLPAATSCWLRLYCNKDR